MSFFERLPIDGKLVELLQTAALPGKNSARNAIRHLEKAATIQEVDPEMAAIRAITAEEEGATAVFHALRRLNYPGSEFLKVRDHVHKNSLWPFCLAVSDLFSSTLGPEISEMQIRIVDGEDGRSRVATAFHVGKLGLGDRFALPQPPLNLRISNESGLHDFTQQIDQLASIRGVTKIRTHLEQRANLRNQLLYASAAGLPGIILNNFLSEQRRTVKVFVVLFLLIDQYEEQQTFADQTLRAFLKMLQRLSPEIDPF